MENFYLAVSWSTSKGRDTYGYNICRLDVPFCRTVDVAGKVTVHGPRRFRCSGGGYDMIGTVVALWLCDRYQDRLLSARSEVTSKYGAYFSERTGRISVDGACGINSVCGIAEAIGLSLSSTHNRRGHTTGFMVTDYGSAEALQAAQS